MGRRASRLWEDRLDNLLDGMDIAKRAPIVSERSAEYYADWTPRQIEDLLAFACREARENASVESR